MKAMLKVKSLEPCLCKVCYKEKANRLSYPKRKDQAKWVLEKVHLDIAGPFVILMNGNCYFITFIDECSRYMEAEVMRRTSEAFICFKAWLSRAMLRHNTRLAVLVSDNGSEYTSKKFQALLRQHRVQHQTTIPDHPRQNGKSEWLNQTILSMIRCVKLESNIPRNPRDHLLQAVVLVLNVRLTRMLPKGIVSWTRWKPPVDCPK
eukprot:Ihof_evm2s727 gene=Ihof_evmTU2s727